MRAMAFWAAASPILDYSWSVVRSTVLAVRLFAGVDSDRGQILRLDILAHVRPTWSCRVDVQLPTGVEARCRTGLGTSSRYVPLSSPLCVVRSAC